MVQMIYTYTDEAPMLASASFLPIAQAFVRTAGIDLVSRDISLSGRIIAAFSDLLPTSLRQPDALADLGKFTLEPDSNIIKLPNISASLPQLQAAIAELQSQGYPLPDYPLNPHTEAERDVRVRYDSVKGSAVNPVLREGNSDRRAPQAVKNYARTHPHTMAPWSPQSRTRVATMPRGDFKHNEVSAVADRSTNARIVFTRTDGSTQVITPVIPLGSGDIVDASTMEAHELDMFLSGAIAAAKRENLLFSLHLKATMMKVSDPVIFGHAIRAFFPRTFARFGQDLARLGVNADHGLGSIFAKIEGDDDAAIRSSFASELESGPRLSMVNSDRGITNLHVPSDVIVDASMPAMIRNGGRLWGPDGEDDDTIAVIPDSSYAEIYQVVIDDCRQHGAFDPATLGSVPNVGLMAQKAEEYGSHDKTFIAPSAGTVHILLDDDTVLLECPVNAGDIFRSCVTRKAPLDNWVELAVERARLSNTPVVFWLDPERAHDRAVRDAAQRRLSQLDAHNLDISILPPRDATLYTLKRFRAGLDTISATGNVLRDYLTDLFPIMELGTSAKMLSIVPLMAGGGLFETGAGGSAPKLVEQLLSENHLRWDSLGEFLALAESLRFTGRTSNNPQATVLANTLDTATEHVLFNGRSPKRNAGEQDNRGSHIWLALYWAQALRDQTDDPELSARFAAFAQELEHNIDSIQDELVALQGTPVDLKGYYHPDPDSVQAIMCPSASFNHILHNL
ncbi:NADP-dependent isocitrate dehydrogenase [Arcanobacterium haemolyticum]|uniref:NADP-dependent isocitrate dehydrogenase n=1 Tax=Arcanobacterium haemolyticum TaxID=28264 RepID=UPI001110253A|nr:NADP-dependent isocitrate dehydrogenase [Arcanobacterium haemolyticum]QCX47208.1 NADP-dependent isocitrate dehydrogenase [Arcanobacterium haemolyticum]